METGSLPLGTEAVSGSLILDGCSVSHPSSAVLELSRMWTRFRDSSWHRGHEINVKNPNTAAESLDSARDCTGKALTGGRSTQ